MTVNLSVPNLTARDTSDLELQPARVKKWLEQLPLLNVVETGRTLLSTLSIHNRVSYDDRLRLQILELFRYPVGQLAVEYAKHYVGLPLPLTDKHRTSAEQNRQFHLEMAYGYKRVVLNLSAAAEPSGAKDRAILAAAIQRAIRYLTGALVVSYEIYAPYPADAWRELHALYALAEELGLIDIPIEDAANAAVTSSSVGHAYKQALLLDFSDPYHLPARMIGWVQHYLDRWAPLAQLTAAASAYHPTCQFLIDRDVDHAGIPYSSGTIPEDPARYRLLNTIELARQAHAHLNDLNAGQTPPADGLRENFFKECGPDLLRRLISAWGVNPQRVFRRSPASGRQLEIAIGMDRINYWINGGKKFVVSSSFVGPLPKRTMLASEVAHQKDVRIPGRELILWDVEDEGPGGFALSKQGELRMHILVGDLLIARTPGGDNPWSVGVIRWIRSASARIEIGIQHLAPSAEPVVVKTVNENGRESDFLPALLLPEIKPLKQPQSLITHRGVFRPEFGVFMDNGCRLHRITPTKLIESTHSFDQFCFDVDNA